MSDARIDAAMADAMKRLAYTSQQGATFTLGPATTGHWCRACGTDSLHAADVLRIDSEGVTPIAMFYACSNCC